MAFNSNLDPRYPDKWELEPSTRMSVALRTKFFPIDVTLATAGTAENLISVASVPATVNLVTNPSAETADPPTGYTAEASTLARDGTYYSYGSYSLKCTPDNAAANEGWYWDLGVLPGRLNEPIPLSISVYARRGAAGAPTTRVRLYGADGTWWNGNTLTLSDSWQRSYLSTQLTVSQNYYLYFTTVAQTSVVFYCDGVQAEILSSVTAYCDGAQGVYHSWDGTAHASTSLRVKRMASIRGYRLHATRDCYVAYDRDADNSSSTLADRGEFIRAGTDFQASGLYLNSKISFINSVAGELPRVYGVAEGVA